VAIFIEVVRLLLKTGRKKEGKRREIIERPRAAIDANKAAEPRARKLSEEMRRLISLLDLDSFLRGRESLSLAPSLFPFTSLALLSRFTGRRPPARNIPARGRYLESLGVYSFIGTIRPTRNIPPRCYVDSHERKRQFVSATPPPASSPARMPTPSEN